MQLAPALAFSLMACSEPVDPNHLDLGRAHFNLTESGFTEAEKLRLQTTMKTAHDRLSVVLGEEVMTMPEDRTVVVKKNHNKEPLGNTDLGEQKVTIGEDLEPHLAARPSGPITLTLAQISEPNLVHEFTHMYAQYTFLWSEAFWEGTVYGLTHSLYPTYYPSMSSSVMHVLNNPCVSKVFSKGWDTDHLNEAVEAGILAPELDNLLHMQWARVWSDFAKAHPDFFPRFYKELHHYVVEGKVDFSRDELWTIALEMSPDFGTWLNNEGASVREMETQRGFFAVETGHAEVSYFNFQTSSQVKKDRQLTPSRAGRWRTGFTRLGDAKVEQEVPNQAFLRISVPGLPPAGKYWITLGDKVIPSLDTQCQPIVLESEANQ